MPKMFREEKAYSHFRRNRNIVMFLAGNSSYTNMVAKMSASQLLIYRLLRNA
jgi:hypothetical protein